MFSNFPLLPDNFFLSLVIYLVSLTFVLPFFTLFSSNKINTQELKVDLKNVHETEYQQQTKAAKKITRSLKVSSTFSHCFTAQSHFASLFHRMGAATADFPPNFHRFEE